VNDIEADGGFGLWIAKVKKIDDGRSAVLMEDAG
jgi:hypothetical protein